MSALRPRPHWGSLQRSPDPLAGFQGGRFAAAGINGGEGREGLRNVGERRRERKGEWGGEKGEVGGIAPWLLGR